jgi:hypothetical protein
MDNVQNYYLTLSDVILCAEASLWVQFRKRLDQDIDFTFQFYRN